MGICCLYRRAAKLMRFFFSLSLSLAFPAAQAFTQKERKGKKRDTTAPFLLARASAAEVFDFVVRAQIFFGARSVVEKLGRRSSGGEAGGMSLLPSVKSVSRFPFSVLRLVAAPVSRPVDKIGEGEVPLEAKLCRSYRS